MSRAVWHGLPLREVQALRAVWLAILVDDHGGSGVPHVGAVGDGLPRIPGDSGGDWLGVGQLCGKHLETRRGYENSGWAEKVRRTTL